MKLTDQLNDDACRNRHRGNENSELANAKVQKCLDRESIFALIQVSRLNGITVKDACVSMGRTPNQISGRFTELKRAGCIKVDGRRDGCGVHFVC